MLPLCNKLNEVPNLLCMYAYGSLVEGPTHYHCDAISADSIGPYTTGMPVRLTEIESNKLCGRTPQSPRPL